MQKLALPSDFSQDDIASKNNSLFTIHYFYMTIAVALFYRWHWFNCRSFFFYHSSHLYYVRPQMAWLVIFFFYYMETLDHSILVSGSISFTYHLIPRGKNHLNIAHIAFADGGNRTRAACAASKCAIHYSIASRQNEIVMQLFLSL